MNDFEKKILCGRSAPLGFCGEGDNGKDKTHR